MCKAKKIEIVFENCESMVFSPSEIGIFDIENIRKDIWRQGINYIGKGFTCEEFLIELFPKANRNYQSFGAIEHATTTFGRVQRCNDITNCYVTYEDDSQDHIMTPWDNADECGCNNKLQSSYLSKNGALYIYIGRQGDVMERIDLEGIESEGYAEIHFNECYE